MAHNAAGEAAAGANDVDEAFGAGNGTSNGIVAAVVDVCGNFDISSSVLSCDNTRSSSDASNAATEKFAILPVRKFPVQVITVGVSEQATH